MKTITAVAMIAIIGCVQSEEAPTANKTKYYCVHNGYSSWSPICKEMNQFTWGSELRDCVDGNTRIEVIYNPTNVTECYP
jgi:hypothetical protein